MNVNLTSNELMIDHGWESEYDDFYLWAEHLEEGSDAIFIGKPDEYTDPYRVHLGTLKKVIKRSECSGEEEYGKKIRTQIFNKDFDVTAEFISDKDIVYVGMNYSGEELKVNDFRSYNCEYC